VGVSGDSGYPAWGRWELDMVGLQDPELHRESEGSGCAGTPGLCIPGSLHPCPRVLCTPGPAPQAPPDSPCPGPGLCFERLPGAQAPWGPGAVPCPPPAGPHSPHRGGAAVQAHEWGPREGKRLLTPAPDDLSTPSTVASQPGAAPRNPALGPAGE
jgi:hypothetical protein